MTIETDGQQAAPEATAHAGDSAEVANNMPEATAGTDEAESLDGDENTADAGRKPAKGVQKRLDELTRLRHDAERDRDYWRELAMRQVQPQPGPAPQHTAGPPREDQFDSYEAYEEARIAWAVDQRLQQQMQMQQRQTVLRTYEERAAKLRESRPDYDSVVSDPTLPISELMAEVIRESDVGPEVAYHLGTNRSEAQRIAALPPHRQAAELGRIEAALTAAKAQPAPQPNRPIPPAPPQTVSGLSAGISKRPEDMSMAEYVAARKAGHI